MSFQDLYQDQSANQQIRPEEVGKLPATAGEAFGAAWSGNKLVSDSLNLSIARAHALQDYLDEIKQKTGADLSKEFVPDVAGGGQTSVTDFTRANERVAKMKADYPDLDMAPLSDDEINKRAIAKSREAQTNYEEMAAREKTFGGKIGFAAGGFAAAGTDPFNIAGLAVAPEAELGILATALKWGGIMGVTQAGIEAAGGGYHEQVQPGYQASGQPLANIGEAALGGGITGGILKGLGKAWARVQSGVWPTSVRDAGNVVSSEANIEHSNIYPGPAGEVAHRDALAASTDQILKGEPVNVAEHITPELQAHAETRFAPLLEARDAAIRAQSEADAERAASQGSGAPELPFGQTEKMAQAEGHIGDMAFEIQGIARRGGNELSRTEAEAIAQRMMKLPDEDMAAAIDHLLQNPSTVAERPVPIQAGEPANPIIDPAMKIAKDLGSPLDIAQKWLKDPEGTWNTIDELVPQVKAAERALMKKYGVKSIADLEDAPLTKQEDEFLFRGKQMTDIETLRDMQNQLGSVSSLDEAARDIAHELKRLPENTTDLSISDQMVVARLQVLFSEVDRLGGNLGEVIKSAGAKYAARFGDPNDAEFMAKNAAEQLRNLFGYQRQERVPLQIAADTTRTLEPKQLAKDLASPEHEQAMRADIDRARMTGDKKIPIGTDEKGEPIYRSLDSAMKEVDEYTAAADHIQACANPTQEPTEKAA